MPSSNPVPRVVLFGLLLSVPLHLYAAEVRPEIASVVKTVIPDVPEQVVIEAPEAVVIDQAMAGVERVEPVILAPHPGVSDTGVRISEPALELEKSGQESATMIEPGGVADPQWADRDARPTSDFDRITAGEPLSDAAPALAPTDTNDRRVASARADRPYEPAGKVAGLLTGQELQGTNLPSARLVNEASKAVELQSIPTPVVLALIALIGVVPISRRGSTRS